MPYLLTSLKDYHLASHSNMELVFLRLQEACRTFLAKITVLAFLVLGASGAYMVRRSSRWALPVQILSVAWGALPTLVIVLALSKRVEKTLADVLYERIKSHVMNHSDSRVGLTVSSANSNSFNSALSRHSVLIQNSVNNVFQALYFRFNLEDTQYGFKVSDNRLHIGVGGKGTIDDLKSIMGAQCSELEAASCPVFESSSGGYKEIVMKGGQESELIALVDCLVKQALTS